MTDHGGLMLDLVRGAARHSAHRGHPLSDVLRAGADALRAGTETTGIGWVAEPPVGADLLVAHELSLTSELADAGIGPQEGSAPSAPAEVDEEGQAWLPLEGEEGLLGWLVLATPTGGWSPTGDDLRFAHQVVGELREVVLRHWYERQQLDRSAALLEAQRHTHVGCFEWDIVADKVRWSDELFRIFGSEPQSFEPTFEEFLERIHDDDREAVRASVFQAYEERRDYRIEERIVRDDGTVRQLASWGHVIVDEHTVPVKIIGSCQDVTDFRAAMAELSRRERELAEVRERRARAFELNDNVVQGLAAALYALELGHPGEARAELAGTLEAARTIIDHMLEGSADAGADRLGSGLARVQAAPAHLASVEMPARPAPSAEPVRVVIADDASDIRLLTSAILAAEADFEVVAMAADGAEAVTLVTAHRPDLILLDLAMPVLDGMSAIPLLLEASPGTVIVAFSGFHAGAAADEATARGAHAYVEKGHIDMALPVLLRSILATSAPVDAPAGSERRGR